MNETQPSKQTLGGEEQSKQTQQTVAVFVIEEEPTPRHACDTDSRLKIGLEVSCDRCCRKVEVKSIK